MSHHDFVKLNGNWYGSHVPTGRDMQKLDSRAAKGIDGTNGGTWNPLKSIVIGGQAGVGLSGTVSIEGGVTTSRGGRMQHGNSDFAQFSSNRSRIIQIPFLDYGRPLTAKISTNPLSWGVLCSSPATSGGAFMIPHHGATISNVTLNFRVGVLHGSLPSTFPGLYILRQDSAGAVVQLFSGAFPGIRATTAASVAAYFNGGAGQSFSAVPNQNAVLGAQYSYQLGWIDGVGGGALPGNIFHSATVTFSSIPDMTFE